MDDLDELLAEARPTVADDAPVRAALADIVAVRTRRRRLVAPVIVAPVIVALGGVGAAYAAGAFDWRIVADPDYSIARDWYDLAGNFLGSCEVRVDVKLLDEQVRPIVEEWFATHDIDAYAPNPEWVAAKLFWRGDPERMPQLLEGETVDAYRSGISGQRGSGFSPQDRLDSDARILHDALWMVVHREISGAIFAAEPDLGSTGIESIGELRCTTDPDYEG